VHIAISQTDLIMSTSGSRIILTRMPAALTAVLLAWHLLDSELPRRPRE
jgi:hypothetical protein